MDIEKRIEFLKNQGTFRELKTIDSTFTNSARIILDGQDAVNFCSNDYLGMSRHPEIARKIHQTVDLFGCSAGGSRFISGNSNYHILVEQELANFHNKESCLIFGSGYTANTGALSCIPTRDDILFSDELNHASIIDGCKISPAKTIIWKHNDLDDLRQKLRNTSCIGKKIIVLESLYSMDGDFSDLPSVVDIAREFNAQIYLDEIHAVGIYGPNGKGIAAKFNLEKEIDFLMSGAGKGLGCVGGYICCSSLVRDLMISSSRPFIFTTALPPIILAAISKSIELVSQADDLREMLNNNANYLRNALEDKGVFFKKSTSHIFPIITGDGSTTNWVQTQLLSHGMYAQGVRFPSVPKNMGRLRVSVSPHHTFDQLKKLVSKLEELKEKNPTFAKFNEMYKN